MTKYWTVTKFLFELRKARLLKLFREFEKLNCNMNQVQCANSFLVELQSFKKLF